MKPYILVLSSPSGGGKTTIARRLLEGREDLGYSVSATTRRMRAGERDGVDYHFVTAAEFERQVAAGEFVEWAIYGGERYGTLHAEVQKLFAEGRIAVLDIDVQGARQVRSRGAQTIGVFVLPPSFETLEQRLRGRSKDSEEAIRKRLATARREVRAVAEYEYVIVNDELESCVDRLRAIVLAERARSRVMAPAIAQIAASFAVSGKDSE